MDFVDYNTEFGYCSNILGFRSNFIRTKGL